MLGVSASNGEANSYDVVTLRRGIISLKHISNILFSRNIYTVNW
jgi:hypothetical protein